MISRRDPGRLWEAGILEMARHLGVREGASPQEVEKEAAGRAVTYLNAIFHGAHPPGEVGVRTCQEMKTVAEALDALALGQLPRLGDLLMQRFKALEVSVTDRGRSLASQLEVTDGKMGLTNEDEKLYAARAALIGQKVNDAKKKLAGGGRVE